MLRALGFAFSFTFHSHRHAADKWADRAGSALPVSLFLSPFIHTAMRRISGRARRSRPTDRAASSYSLPHPQRQSNTDGIGN
jgi:hypothetical protein